MSKMPKKKSCFQITSVTQAQVAASCITDDTESRDEPDESRTEDVSSEIYEVSQTYLGVCKRSSSEETLSYNGESLELLLPSTGPFSKEASHKIIGPGQLGTYNSGGSLSRPATSLTNGPSTQPSPMINMGPASSVPGQNASVSTNGSSRFRVIKLDHGTGEPFRRGRWICTEFFERESDLNIHKAVDSIKTGLTVVCSIERHSGLGATINSVVSSTGLSLQAFQNTTDDAFSPEQPSHVKTLDYLQQDYSLAPQLGSWASAFQSTGYTTTSPEKPQLAQGNIQPVVFKTCPQDSLNGVHQSVVQNSPLMPPIGVSTDQKDYYQQLFGSSPSAHVSWSQSNQVVSLELVSAGQSTQVLDGEARLAKDIQLQEGNAPALAPILTGSDQQQNNNQAQSLGSVGISLASSLSSHGGVHNAFAIVTGTSLSRGHVQPHIAQVGLFKSLPSSLGNHAEDRKQAADSPPHINAVAVPGSDGVKPFITDGLGLPAPAVNGLFGIHIAMNDDEDR